MNPTTPCPTTVPALTRRRFLAWSGVAAGTAVAAGGCSVSLPDLLHRAGSDPLDSAAGVLVVVTLYGGNDGLNTVVPVSDPRYQQSRPDLAYQPDQVLDLGDGVGLNPAMTGLKSLWDSQRLAILPGAGYPEPDRSHFRSMAIWQTASPKTPVDTGWLGRWLDLAGDPLRALSLDPVLPPMLAGARTAGAALSRTGRRPRSRQVDAVLSGWASADQGHPLELEVAGSYRDLLAAEKAFSVDTGDPSEDTGTSELAGQLARVATLVEAGAPSRVYSVSLGGFDTHSDEKGTQENLLRELDAALTAFQQRLDRTARGGQVVTLVYSEFGRRVAANASDGTDHGSAGPVFVMGRGVRGGFHGAQPDLGDLLDGDLRAVTDFRSIYASALGEVLGAEPGGLLDGWETRVDGLFV